MAGIEVVGIVLGTWPIVIDLAKTIKNANDGTTFGDLELKFKTDLHIMRETVSHMLESIDELPEKERIILSNTTRESQAYWERPDLSMKLEGRLGNAFPLIVAHMKNIHRVLNRLQTKLGGEDASLGQGLNRNMVRNMRDTRSGSSLRKDLRELEDRLNSLRRLLKATRSPIVQETSRPQSRRPGKLSAAMKRISKNPHYFNNFYQALNASFHCNCKTAHDINVRLKPDAFEALVAVQEDLQRSYSDPNIDLVGSTVECDGSESARREAVKTSTTRGEQRAIPVIFSQTVPEIDSGTAQIPDLCQLIRSLHHPESHRTRYLGYLGKDENKYLVKIPLQKVESDTSQCIICLDDYFAPSMSWNLSWRKRVDLAHSLTLALFQFYPSNWIDKRWSWKDFSMRRSPRQLHLFITRKFYSDYGTPLSQEDSATKAANDKFWKTLSVAHKIDPALGRLGCALVELALGNRLSELRDQVQEIDEDTDEEEDDDDMAPDGFDYCTARRLLDTDKIRDQAGDSYHRAVEACLLCEVLEGSGTQSRHRLSSRSNNFQDDFEKYVVEPLRDYHFHQWGEIIDDGF